LKRLQESAREKRLLNFGPEKEPEFEPKLQKFRDDMLKKLDPSLLDEKTEDEDIEDAGNELNAENSKIHQLTREMDNLLELDEEKPKIQEIVDDEQPKIQEIVYDEQPKIQEIVDDEQTKIQEIVDEDVETDVPDLEFVDEAERRVENVVLLENTKSLIQEDSNATLLIEEINIEDKVREIKEEREVKDAWK
jgi:hypothetical protein